ncbi:hypothetical protein [Candidatus Ichthyocystis hellenicum]|uniref:hypothetical protein n=1 Tax=Candidatus Ichthyocystis hellenicum TaxID=1561003 RepID=UPI0011127EF1|nr:hypothetical protein [Candidatus Ichthyocystis hellenicum]
MEKITYSTPRKLEELSIGSLFGVNCKESIEHLMQINYKEAIEFALLIKRKNVHYNKYESVFDENVDLFHGSYSNFCCENYNLFRNSEELMILGLLRIGISKVITETDNLLSGNLKENKEDGYWINHPVYSVVHTANIDDIAKNYYKKRSEILSLPEPSSPEVLASKKDKPYYQDPLCFFPSMNNYTCNINIIHSSVRTINSEIDLSMSTLKRSHQKMRKQLYNLSMALLFQIKSTVSLLTASLLDRDTIITSKEEQVLKSLKVVICLRNYADSINSLKGTILPIIQACNFTHLEDVLEVLKVKISRSSINTGRVVNHKLKKNMKLLYKAEISRINCFLSKKYRVIIARKRRELAQMKKIDQYEYNEVKSKSVSTGNNSVKKLESEIAEMATFLGKISEEKEKAKKPRYS